jgi:hypothetical protein
MPSDVTEAMPLLLSQYPSPQLRRDSCRLLDAHSLHKELFLETPVAFGVRTFFQLVCTPCRALIPIRSMKADLLQAVGRPGGVGAARHRREQDRIAKRAIRASDTALRKAGVERGG